MLISPKERINPNVKYSFYECMHIDRKGSQVFVFAPQSNFQGHKVVNMSWIPFESGKIHYIDPTNGHQLWATQEFHKGPYVKRVYDLVHKVNFIRKKKFNLHDSSDAIGFTHEGRMIPPRGKLRARVDLRYIDEEYRKAGGRAIPNNLQNEFLRQKAQRRRFPNQIIPQQQIEQKQSVSNQVNLLSKSNDENSFAYKLIKVGLIISVGAYIFKPYSKL